MDITKILNIGLGRCGNNLVDILMSKDSRYKGLMIDSFKTNMFSLNNSSRCGNIVIPYYGGTEELMHFNNIADEIIKYDNNDLFVLYFSMSEEFGSNYVENVAKAIRDFIPHSKIVAIGVIPKTSSLSKTKCENIIRCWDRLMYLRYEVINGFRFIDNDTRKTVNEVNESAIRDLDLSFKLNLTENIDEVESFRINCEDGYHMTYFLHPNIKDIENALMDSEMQSVFLTPPSLNCDCLGASIKNHKYNETIIKNLFSVNKHFLVGESYYDAKNNIDVNVILATGMSMPIYKMKKIQKILEEI